MTYTLSSDRTLSQNSSAPNDDLEIALVRLLIRVGFQHKRIAALFDCNQGRIAEISTGEKRPEIDAEFSIVKNGEAT